MLGVLYQPHPTCIFNKVPLPQPVNSRTPIHPAPSGPRTTLPRQDLVAVLGKCVRYHMCQRSITGLSSQFCMTAMVRHWMKPVATHSYPHMEKCPTSLPPKKDSSLHHGHRTIHQTTSLLPSQLTLLPQTSIPSTLTPTCNFSRS